MFDPKSDYALNKKDLDAIVYIDAAGTLTRLTLADFSSLEEFQRWKAWSDESYHQVENAAIALSKRTLSLHGLSEKATAVQSPEDTLMEALKQQEREEMRRLLMEGLDNCLTSAQRRRLWLYFVDGLTVRQIAEAEGVQHPSIVECLAAAKKRLLEYLKRMV